MNDSRPKEIDAPLSDSPFASGPPRLDGLLLTRRRRHVIRCLREFRAPMALADLAYEVAKREEGTPVPEISAETATRVYMSLYHIHLPKLTDAGIVEYTDGQGLITLSTESERIDSLRADGTADP